ncbi:MAG: hypothetical protein CNIPEHKO_01598 [Anaerolineales bacterium]|nr:hypothetical protein [Anaerolineales bacterium]
MTTSAVIATIGGIALLVALFGGVELEKAKIPPLPKNGRVTSGFFGIILIGISVWLSLPQTSSPETVVLLPTSISDVTIQTAEQPSYSPTEITQQTQPTNLANAQPIQSSPTETAQAPIDNCSPPNDLGLIYLSEFTNPRWSSGIWGSANMLNFIVDQGVIDTNDPDFGEFQLWISSCYPNDYKNGDGFWPLTEGPPPTAPPIYLDTLITHSTIPKNTGLWGLGKQFKP